MTDPSIFDDVVDWLAIRMAFDGCEVLSSSMTGHTMTGHLEEAADEADAKIEFHLISIHPPDDASDILNRTGLWTFTWIGRVSGTNPLNTKQAIKWIGEVGRGAGALVDAHVFEVADDDDDETETPEIERFYQAPMMTIESLIGQQQHWW